MADDYFDEIAPVAGKQPIEPVESRRHFLQQTRQARSITGRVSAVHRGRRQASPGHVLDLTVGADEFTEIVVRVPPGVYTNLEGKRAVLYVDE